MKRKRSYESLPPSGEHSNPWLARIAAERNPVDNRRAHARRAVTADMMICQCVTCFGRWPVRDLSLGGAFVNIPRRGMPVGMAVDVALQFRLHGTTVERRLFAQVARVAETGIALIFQPHAPEVHADLVAFLSP